MIKIQTPFGIGEFLGMETDIEAVSTGIASCPIRHDIRGPAMSSVRCTPAAGQTFTPNNK